MIAIRTTTQSLSVPSFFCFANRSFMGLPAGGWDGRFGLKGVWKPKADSSATLPSAKARLPSYRDAFPSRKSRDICDFSNIPGCTGISPPARPLNRLRMQMSCVTDGQIVIAGKNHLGIGFARVRTKEITDLDFVAGETGMRNRSWISRAKQNFRRNISLERPIGNMPRRCPWQSIAWTFRLSSPKPAWISVIVIVFPNAIGEADLPHITDADNASYTARWYYTRAQNKKEAKQKQREHDDYEQFKSRPAILSLICEARFHGMARRLVARPVC